MDIDFLIQTVRKKNYIQNTSFIETSLIGTHFSMCVLYSKFNFGCHKSDGKISGEILIVNCIFFSLQNLRKTFKVFLNCERNNENKLKL